MNSLVVILMGQNLFSGPWLEESRLHIFLVLMLVVLVILAQLISFIRTWHKINRFRNIFADLPGLKMEQLIIPEEVLKNTSPSDIIAQARQYKELTRRETDKLFIDNANEEGAEEYVRRGQSIWLAPSKTEKYTRAGWLPAWNKQAISSQKWVEIPFLENLRGYHPVLTQIVHNINTYLIRNAGSVSDFHLMKDIVDRNCDNVDEEINTALPAPLYLGLMGTMFGIILSVGVMTITGDLAALFNTEPGAQVSYNAITVLLGGVGLAMISSLTGLAMTMGNSILNYKGAKSKVERLKNDFFTFIQTELLPVLSQNAASSLRKLEGNLNTFNQHFDQNNRRFNETLMGIHTTFESHAQMIEELREIDLKTLTQFNAKVLRELKENTEQFAKFNIYLDLVNSLIENADKLNMKLNQQIDRTRSIEEVARHIQQNTEENKEIIDFMGRHFLDLRERTALFNSSITQVDEALKKSVEELRLNVGNVLGELHDFTANRVSEIRDIQLEQVSAVSRNQNLFDHLQHLRSIDDGMKELSRILKNQGVQLERMNQQLTVFQPQQGLSGSANQNVYDTMENYARKVFFVGGSIIIVVYGFKELVMFIVRTFL